MNPSAGAAELGRSYDCKQPGCPNAARSPVGRYAYCDQHQKSRAADKTTKTPNVDGGVAGELRSILTLAAEVDRKRAKARAATERALAAKRDADQAETDYRDALRSAVNGGAS